MTSRHYSPFRSIFVDLFALVVVLIVAMGLAKLGFWQLQRYHFKQALQQRYTVAISQATLELGQLETQAIENLEFRSLYLKGYFDNSKQYLLDNRTHQGQAGYDVITPFIADGAPERPILVNRGWIPIGRSRRELPSILPILGHVEIRGVVTLPTKKPLFADQAEHLSAWPKRIPWVDLPQMSEQLQYPGRVMPLLLQLSPGQAYGFVYHWRPTQYQPERHLGYAVQWFGLAVALIVMTILYIGLRSRKMKS